MEQRHLWDMGGTDVSAYVDLAVLSAILNPLVTRPGLRRAAGKAGQIETGKTQFPKHFAVEWEQASSA